MVKVSVIIAAYCSGSGIDGLVASLDAQTLPSSDFEVVWVDDGSPDDTYERLQAFAATRPNYVVRRIDNSGWPGRPRNVGVHASQGEYLFFADHDDYLFPEALERVTDFARRNRLDMVMPKEVVAGWARPGWPSWRRQIDLVDDFDQAILQCITPHKLYRREWVVADQIWFPEGRIRLEDFDYNAQAWARAERIGVFAEYPCYKWIIHDGNSHSAGYDFTIYWSSFEKSLDPILALPTSSQRRDQLLVRWYRSRILERYGPRYAGYSEDFRIRLDGVVAHLLDRFPESIDRLLTPSDRARSALLRAGDRQSLLVLARADTAPALPATVTAAWEDGRLHIEATGTLHDQHGPMRFDRRGDDLVRILPPELDGSAADGIDVGRSLGRVVGELIVRARSSAVDWTLPSHGSVWAEPGDDGAQVLSWRIDGDFDPRTAAGGRPLDRDVWDVYFRLDGLGWYPTQWLPAPAEPLVPALIGGIAVTPYSTVKNHLALDTADAMRTVIGSANPSLTDARVAAGADGQSVIAVALPAVHVAGDTQIPGNVTIDGRSHPAVMVGHDGAARVEISARRLVGRDVRACFGGRPSAALFAGQLRALRSERRGGKGNLLERITAEAGGILTPADRDLLNARAAGDAAEFRALQRRPPLSLDVSRRSVSWQGDVIVLRLQATVIRHDLKPVRFRRDGARVLAEHEPGVRSTDDVSVDIAATSPVVVLRGRESKLEHLLAGESSCTLVPMPDEWWSLQVDVTARLDAAVAADGKPLRRDVWDPWLHLDALGWVEPTRVPAAVTEPFTALVSGIPLIAYATVEGNLAFDIAERVHNFVESAQPELADAVRASHDGRPVVRVPLRRTKVAGETELTGTLMTSGRDLPARLIGSDGVAELVVDGELANAGAYATFTGRRSTSLVLCSPMSARINRLRSVDTLVRGGRRRLTAALRRRRSR